MADDAHVRFDLDQIRSNARELEKTMAQAGADDAAMGMVVARESLAMADRLESLAKIARELRSCLKRGWDHPIKADANSLCAAIEWSVKE